MFVLKIIVAFFAFIIQIQLGRMLGMEDYGEFSLFLSISSLVSLLPLLGMDSGLIREIAATKSREKRKWCIVISLCFSLFILVLLVMLMPWIFPYFVSSLSLQYSMEPLLLLYIIILVLNSLSSAVLQGEQLNVFNDGTTAFTSFAKVIVVYFLGLHNFGFFEVMLSYVFLEMLCMIGRWGSIYYRYKNVKVIWQPLNEVKKFLLYCLPLFFVSSIGIMQCSLHRFVTVYFMDAYSVGVMRVCETFSSALSLFVAPFVTTWPLMASYYREHRLDEIHSMFKQCSIAITAMVMPALTIVIVCAPELLQLFNLSVNDNQELVLVLFVFCIGTVYDSIIGPAGALLKMTKYSRVNFYNAIILMILTIVFSYIMIPSFGLLGAALAFSLSHVVINTLNALQNYRLFGLMPYGKAQIGLLLWSVPVYWFMINFRNAFDFKLYNVFIFSVVIYILYGWYIVICYKEKRLKLLSYIKSLL